MALPCYLYPRKMAAFGFDYRWLNKCTIRNRYPLTLPEEMLDRLGGARVFSKTDLKLGYWQMLVHE